MTENNNELTEERVEEVEIEEELTLDDFETEEEVSLEDLDDDLDFLDETPTEEVEVPKTEEKEDDDEFPDMNPEAIKPIEHETKSAVGSGARAAAIRLVNTKKAGKKLMIKPQAIEELGVEDALEIGLIDDTLVIAKEGIADVEYTLREQEKMYMVYNSKLVEDITEALSLDFSNCSTVGLEKIKYVTKDGKKFLMARK